MPKTLATLPAAGALTLTACGSSKSATSNFEDNETSEPIGSSTTVQAMPLEGWTSLDDMASTIHAVTGNCSRLIAEQNGVGGFGDVDGMYLMALNTAEHQNVSEQHKPMRVANGREEHEVVL